MFTEYFDPLNSFAVKNRGGSHLKNISLYCKQDNCCNTKTIWNLKILFFSKLTNSKKQNSNKICSIKGKIGANMLINHPV